MIIFGDIFWGSGYDTDVYLFAKNQSQSGKEILTTEEHSNLIGQEHLIHARVRRLKINSVCLFLSFMSIYIQKIKVTCYSPQEISVIEEYLNLIDQWHF